MDEYIYSSARFRVKELSLIGTERTRRLLEAQTTARCVQLLSEFGVKIITDPESGKFLREETLSLRLRTAYEELLEDSPDARFLKLWLYPYDCNNLKAAIKCKHRGIDPTDLLFDFGTVELGDILYMAEQGDFEKLPEPFASAAAEAVEAFSKTANPQWVDLILDRACYKAMLLEARASKVALAIRLVERKIDLTNLLILIRLLRMHAGESGKTMLQNAWIEGGTLDLQEFSAYYDAGEAVFWERLSYLDSYRRFALAVNGTDATLTEIERAADNDFMALVREAKSYPYGAEPLLGYLLASEYESRNLRIILAAFEAGLSVLTVEERIRDCYV